MSEHAERRVLTAQGLEPAHRMVLFAVARQLPDGQTEVLVNRTALARALETTTGTVQRALAAGERLGLVQVLRSGRVAFAANAALPIVEPSERQADPVTPAIRPAEPLSRESSPGRLTAQGVLGEFARQWEAVYKQRYVFTPGKDHRLAASLTALTSEDYFRRVRNYLSSPDEFYARCAHSFGVFASRVNSFATTERPRVRPVDAEEDDDYGRIARQTRKRADALRQAR